MTDPTEPLLPPDQVFVDAPGGADVGLDCVLVLAELSAQTQVLEEAEQKLLPLRPPHGVVILRPFLLQHLEGHGKNPGWTVIRSGSSQIRLENHLQPGPASRLERNLANHQSQGRERRSYERTWRRQCGGFKFSSGCQSSWVQLHHRPLGVWESTLTCLSSS